MTFGNRSMGETPPPFARVLTRKGSKAGKARPPPSERIQKVGNCRCNAGVGERQMGRGRPNRVYIVQWAHSTGEKIG